MLIRQNTKQYKKRGWSKRRKERKHRCRYAKDQVGQIYGMTAIARIYVYVLLRTWRINYPERRPTKNTEFQITRTFF